MWGLIFVGPQVVPEYPAVCSQWGAIWRWGLSPSAAARPREAAPAFGTGLVGCLRADHDGQPYYYVCLASAIQRTGAPSPHDYRHPAVVLPVLLTCSTASATASCRGGVYSRRWRALRSAWRALISPNCARAWRRLASGATAPDALALISVACWAWYALRNARWLRENPISIR
ncbi:Inner membrane protein ytfF [Raoultella terrigena]|uniref:Inner membrane protein ytfF n=1 Tax=Raoultella terrigena TaxID=577 RepID=A0A4U9D4K0_RAOTE|nr:Inner membrane protein ytfF [Raoultella terrigena]